MSTTRRRFIRGAAAAVSAAAVRATPALARRRKARRKKPDPQWLFRDRFDRRDASGWGWPWFNQRYGRRWVVSDGRGIYRLPASENKMYYRPNPIFVLDHDVANADLRTTISMSNAQARFGFVARAAGYADYYAAHIGPGNHIRVVRCGHHDEKVLGRKPFHVEANRRYRLRFQVRGANPVRLKVKAWPVTEPEPRAWNIDTADASPGALTGRGPFGLFAEHAVDGRGAALKVSDFVAWSQEKGSYTVPSVTYSMAGPIQQTRVKAVAKTDVPARVGFEYGPDATFTSGVRRARAGLSSPRAQTASAWLDLDGFAPSSIVHWRAWAERRGVRVHGPASSFRMPPAPGLPVKFAFGSCTRWKPSPRRSFEQARLQLPDFYIHQGDFGYVPHRVVAHAPDTYQDHWIRMILDPAFQSLARSVPIGLSQDDADYGTNLADRNTLRRFTIRAHDELSANPRSAYYTFRCGDVAVFVIDSRRYSTGKKVPPGRRTKLGAEQKQWLFDEMTRAAEDDAGLCVVASPQAFGSDRSPASWRKGFEQEWRELMDFFESLAAPVLIVSGDAHGHRLHEYPQKNLDPSVPRIVELVSSGTEQNKFSDDLDPRILLRQAKGSGFGVVELGPEEETGGQRVRSLTLSALRSTDGTPFWTPQRYLIVRGVGIVPVIV
ncbi:MAG TPA: alkaline phosphatase D family protein [Actinomycetota bacterium]|nr:alkaline phosphatase D family protein [Actinomycetota bacterium]